MPNYALHDGVTVVNVIIADSVAIAEDLSGLSAIETDGTPWMGWTMEAEGWRPPSPFPSWTWNGSMWESPVERPTGDYAWDEDGQQWARAQAPYPSWQWSGTEWQPPVPAPSDDGLWAWDEIAQEWVGVEPDPVTE